MLAARGQAGFWGVALPSQQPCSCRPQAPAITEAAHKKGGGSTKNGRDSNGQRRGVKVYGGQPVKAGGIIVRQVGCKFHPGVGVKAGVDWSLYAVQAGIVVYSENSKMQKVSVVPEAEYQPMEEHVTKPDSRRARRVEFFAKNGSSEGRTAYSKEALAAALAR